VASDIEMAEQLWTDEELTELALAADPGAPLSGDAVPLSLYLSKCGAVLPLWYMPPAVAHGGRRWKLPIVIAIVSAFLLIEALGLCNTYGTLGWA